MSAGEARPLSDGTTADLTLVSGSKSIDGQEFLPLDPEELAVFYRHLQAMRAEPLFIDIKRPFVFPSLDQFLELYDSAKRPIWVMGPCAAPIAYFAFHDVQRQHDLASLDFGYFSSYPGSGTSAARRLWNALQGRLREWGLTRIQSFQLDTSKAKIELLESLGFVREGVLREHYFHNGRLHDLNLLSWVEEGRHG